MAFMLAHEWIAELVLKKLSKKSLISGYNDIDDYFFGAIAPDVRYINNSDRAVTHEVEGKDSIFKTSKKANGSKAFLAGFETHLIVDIAWSNQKKWMDKSIYEFYSVDANNLAQKFALYFIVDDYFEGETSPFFSISCSGNVARANESRLLTELGFDAGEIFLYKSLAAVYLRNPGVDTLNVFNFVPSQLDEILMRKLLDQKPAMTSFLKEFKRISVEKCIESLERNL